MIMATNMEGYSNDSQGKLGWLLDSHYNMFHADMISRALHDDSVTIQDFIHGCVSIAMAERDMDDDEFIPKEFENV